MRCSTGAPAYSVCRDLVARACSLHGRRWVQLQVEPHVQYSNHQEFSLDVDADHPDRASTSTRAIARLDRPTGAVEVRVHSQTTLRALSIKAEIDLDGSLTAVSFGSAAGRSGGRGSGN